MGGIDSVAKAPKMSRRCIHYHCMRRKKHTYGGKVYICGQCNDQIADAQHRLTVHISTPLDRSFGLDYGKRFLLDMANRLSGGDVRDIIIASHCGPSLVKLAPATHEVSST